MDQDPFAFIDVEAGALSPSQRALILASPFINDDSNQALDFEKGDKGEDPVDPLEVYDPLDGEAEVNLEEMDILEIAAMKGIRFDPPKWHRPGGYDVKKTSVCIPPSENDKEKLPVLEQERTAPKAAIDLFEVFEPSWQELTTKLENMDILEIAAMKGIHFDPPKWHRPGGYDVEKTSMCTPLGENDKEKMPVLEQEQTTPKASIELFEVFEPSWQELTTKLENMDILEIAAMKGIRFDPPKWHRPGGYDVKKTSMCIPLGENDKEKMPVLEKKQTAPKASIDLFEVFEPSWQELTMKLENMDILEIAAMKGIRFDPPKWHRPGGYDVKKTSMCIPLSENDKEKMPVLEQEQIAPKASIDLFEVFEPSWQELTAKLENMDILEIAAMKGIRFDPPRWHRAGGYGSKGK